MRVVQHTDIHPCHTAAMLSRETKKALFTTLSLAMETMGMRLRVVKQSFFGPPEQYGRLVTRANNMMIHEVPSWPKVRQNIYQTVLNRVLRVTGDTI